MSSGTSPVQYSPKDNYYTFEHLKVGSTTYTAEVSRRLYAYYKYFSQYEHFSESGYGDTLADFDKDNVSFEKAFECLISGMYLLLENIKTSPEILSNS